jgi:hypothetical protein
MANPLSHRVLQSIKPELFRGLTRVTKQTLPPLKQHRSNPYEGAASLSRPSAKAKFTCSVVYRSASAPENFVRAHITGAG